MKFIENGFNKLFLFYEKFKKNVVGAVVAYRLLVGVSVTKSNAISVRVVVYCLVQVTRACYGPIISFGFKNGSLVSKICNSCLWLQAIVSESYNTCFMIIYPSPPTQVYYQRKSLASFINGWHLYEWGCLFDFILR